MEENKDIGLKVAKDPEHARWLELKELAEKTILNLEIELELQRELYKYLREKIEKFK